MEAAHDFMQRLQVHPIAECGEPMQALEPAARAAGIRIGFPAGLKLGTLPRVFALRATLVPRLLNVAAALLRQGWLLRVEDAYRTLAVQAQGTSCDFIVDAVYRRTQWELGGQAPSLELVLRRIRVLTATTAKTANHVSGSALDISVLDATTGREVDRGGSYLEISERTPMASPFLSRTARRHRDRINDILAAAGFLPYPYEFWHFSHGDADFELVSGSSRPARFGPVDLEVTSGRVTPIPDLFTELLRESAVRDRVRTLSEAAG